jgi:hypothetical protein
MLTFALGVVAPRFARADDAPPDAQTETVVIESPVAVVVEVPVDPSVDEIVEEPDLVTEDVVVEEQAAPVRVGPPTPIGLRYPEPLDDETWRVAYDFERIVKKGILIGNRSFTSTPRKLEVSVHTVQLSYAPHPRVNLMVDIPFVENQLSTTNVASGLVSQTTTKGIGDVEFALVLPFIRKGREASHIHLGVKTPTGSYRRGGDGSRLPYDLQPGNGTWDLEWGWTYRGETDRFAWGGQAVGIHPQGRNGLHYRDGSRFNVTGWGAARLFAGLSASVRLEWEKINNIQGRDRSLDQAADPSNNSKTRGGESIQISPGMSFDLPQLPHQRIAIEATLPLWENLDGAQLKRDWAIEVGWRWGF